MNNGAAKLPNGPTSAIMAGGKRRRRNNGVTRKRQQMGGQNMMKNMAGGQNNMKMNTTTMAQAGGQNNMKMNTTTMAQAGGKRRRRNNGTMRKRQQMGGQNMPATTTMAQAGGARMAVGSKAQVWHGTARHTSGGLTKKDLMKHKGRIVSRKKHALGRKALKNLVKAGYKAKKGTFKLFKH